MELNAGICSICSSNNEVVKSEDCSVFWELITKIFKEEIPNLNDCQINVKICPTCVYKITLIDLKKATICDELKETLANSNNCHLCNSQEHTKVFKVAHSKVLKDFEPYKKLQESGSAICAQCYFVMETICSLQNSLKKLCKSRQSKRKSVENGEKTPENPVNKPAKMEIETSPLGTSIELEHEEKENESTRTPMRTSPRVQKNGEKVVNSTEKSSPATKSRTRIKKPESEVAAVKDEDSDKREVRSKTLRDKKPTTPNGDLKNSNPKKNIKTLDTESTKLEMSDVKLRKIDLSKLSSLVPLCAMKLEFTQEIKTDSKFFNLVPYIKLTNSKEGLKKRKGRQNNGASITKASTGPKQTKMIAKRTPPIKIKFKQGKPSMKPNVSVRNKRTKVSPDAVKENRKMVVKVARLRLSKSGSDKSDEGEGNNENINIIENVLLAKEDLNSSSDFSTPKKKKRVHFNDTPTIIITGDDISDHEEESCKNDAVEEEQEEEEMEDIANVLEESDFQETELSSQKSDTKEVEERNDEDKDITMEETSENKIVNESKEENITEHIDDNEVAVDKQPIFEINDLEETQNETENEEQGNENEPPKQITDEENGPDDKSSTDQNNLDKDSALLDLDIIDECSNDEDAEKTDFAMDTQSTLGKIIETDTNDDNDVIINNEMLSDAADDKENFGSLIDEVQKCLTSSDDFSMSKKQDAECPTVEILDDDSLTCLQDLEVLKGSFTEELIQDNDIAEKQPLNSKRGTSSTSSEISPKKTRFN